MKHRDIPVVLVVAGKKIDYISHVVQNLSSHCNFKYFYVICPRRDLDHASAQSKKFTEEKVVVIDEESIVPGLSLTEVKKYLTLSLRNWPQNNLPGWYLQQFLKMSFSKYAPEYKYFLIWDADTLLTRAISFFEDEKILLTKGNEFHDEYFATIKILFNDITLQSVSHISQHLMVRTTDMIELIDALETPERKWWQNILLSLSGKTPHQFSEYETYANYCLAKKSECYLTTERLWFRYGMSYCGCDLTKADVKNFSGLYDFVAFEDWDSGLLRKIRSHFIVLLQRLNKQINTIVDFN